MLDDPDAMWRPGFRPPGAGEGSPAGTIGGTEAGPDPGDPSRGGGETEPGGPGRAVQGVRGGGVQHTGRPLGIVADPGWVVDGRAVEAADGSAVDGFGWAVDGSVDGSAGFGSAGDGTPNDDRDRHVAGVRRRRTVRAATAAGVAAVVGAVLVVGAFADRSDPRRAGRGEVVADVRRLPPEVEERWSTVLSGTGSALSSSLTVDGDDLAVVVVDDGSRDRSLIAGVDATTGSVRWRRSFTYSPPEISLLGVVDGVVLVEQSDPAGSRVFGLAASDGSTRWEQQRVPGGSSTVLHGTGVVAAFSPLEESAVITILDPASGEPVGTVEGEFVSTDLAGTWYLTDGSRFLALDLRDGWSLPVEIADGGALPVESAAVIDGRVLVLGGDAVTEVVGAERSAITVDGVDVADLTALVPTGGFSALGRAGPEVVGLELVGDTLRTTWRRVANLRGLAITERGVVLTLGQIVGRGSGTSELQVVDTITGDVLAVVVSSAGGAESALVVGDGFVTATTRESAPEYRGYGLDGTELWALSAPGKLRVGDELVVLLASTPAGYALTAYGAP